MSRYRQLLIVAVLVLMAVATVVVVNLWADILSTPAGRGNAATLLVPILHFGLAAFLLGDACRHLPEQVRPRAPYPFAFKALAAVWLMVAIAAGSPHLLAL